MPSKTAQGYIDEADVILPESYIYSTEEINPFPSTLKDYEELDNREDEMDSQLQTTETKVEDLALNKALETSMSSVLWKLQNRERVILSLKFGLNRKIYLTEQEQLYYGMEKNGIEMTFEEIGHYLNISGNRVNQIEKICSSEVATPITRKENKRFLVL